MEYKSILKIPRVSYLSKMVSTVSNLMKTIICTQGSTTQPIAD